MTDLSVWVVHALEALPEQGSSSTGQARPKEQLEDLTIEGVIHDSG
jgi:hypothetical protein